MKPQLKRTLIYIALSLLAIIGISGFFIRMIFESSEKIGRDRLIDDVSFSQQESTEYARDFAMYNKMFRFKEAFYSKTRNPIEKFVYNDYYIFLYKLPINSTKSLTDLITTKYVSTSVQSGVNYYELLGEEMAGKHCNYSIVYKLGKPPVAQDIQFTLSAKNAKVLRKNDTSYCYYTQVNNFSVSYNKSDTVDFFGNLKPGVPPASLPIQITFRKKDNKVYLFIAIENENKMSIDKKLLVTTEIFK